jgi:glutaminyl-tRNA synthetase
VPDPSNAKSAANHPAAPASGSDAPARPARHFLQQIIDADCAAKAWGTWRDGRPKVHTRFPPEPNGYLHVGHAKSICLNFGLASEFGGRFNLRFDDTNPAKEEMEFVEGIIRDVKWLGAAFDKEPNGGGLYWASDYFAQMYLWAEELIHKGLAYVCDLTPDQMASMRGDTKTPARSPFRDRPIVESLDLFRRMRAGEFPNGTRTLRAKVDLASPNFVMRDPVMYRILHEPHHNTGTLWCIYPMYDWAHCLEDSLEGITHSICTLEFRNNRPLYDWFIDAINQGRTDDGSGRWGRRIHVPKQHEFAKLIPTHTVLSKRNLRKMVENGTVSGWDDPRMPTICGMRRRGYTPQAIRAFCEDIGVTAQESRIDPGRLENAVRDHLNRVAPRAMAVLRPLKVTIENWPKDASGSPVIEELDFVINPEDPAAGTRKVPFSGTLFIERDDFEENPPKKFFRLAPVANGGLEVRLRWAYFIKAHAVVKDHTGAIVEVLATYDPATRGGDAPLNPDGTPSRKVKGTLHWVSERHATNVEVRLFDRMFLAEEPGERTGDFMDDLNPASLEVVHAMVEPALVRARAGDVFQFERLGYFRADEDSKPGAPVFNRTVTLKDSWSTKP